MSSESPGPRQNPIHHLGPRSLLPWESLILIIVSIGDLLMTYTLLWWSGRFYESNPIADWVLNRWDITGLTLFKFGLVAFIILACETIERHRPRVGRAVLILGILGTLYGIVVGYRLFLEHG